MEFILIDYSAEHFGSLPIRRGGKFIQVIQAHAQYIIMSPRELSVFHANIAERFFNARGIRGRYNHKRDSYHLEHPEWAILGGGHWEVDDETRILTLSGTSMAYGRFHGQGVALHMEDALPGYKVIIKS